MIDYNNEYSIVFLDDNFDLVNVESELLSLKLPDYKNGLIKTKSIKYFTSGSKFIDYLKEGNIVDVLILDIMMPEMNGVEVLKQISELKLKIKVIVLTDFTNPYYVFKFEEYNVDSIISKSDKSEWLLPAIEHVLNDCYMVSPLYFSWLKAERKVAQRKMQIENNIFNPKNETETKNDNQLENNTTKTINRNPSQAKPTIRELEILDLKIKGHSDKEISSNLNITINTIKQHKQHLKKKFSVNSFRELLKKARELKWY